MAGNRVGSGGERLVLEGSGGPSTSRLGNVHTQTLRAKVALLFASIAPMMPTAMGLPLSGSRRVGGGSLSEQCDSRGTAFFFNYDSSCINTPNGIDTTKVISLGDIDVERRLDALSGNQNPIGDFAALKMLVDPELFTWTEVKPYEVGCTADVGGPDIKTDKWRLPIPEELKDKYKIATVIGHGKSEYLEKALVNFVLGVVKSLAPSYQSPSFAVNEKPICELGDLLDLPLKIKHALLLLVARHGLEDFCQTGLKPSITKDGVMSFSLFVNLKQFINEDRNQDFSAKFSRFVSSEPEDEEVEDLFNELINSGAVTVEQMLDFLAFENQFYFGLYPQMLLIRDPELLKACNVTLTGAGGEEISTDILKRIFEDLIKKGETHSKEFELSKLMPSEEEKPGILDPVADADKELASHILGLKKVLEDVLNHHAQGAQGGGTNAQGLPNLLLSDNNVRASSGESFTRAIQHVIMPVLTRYLMSLGVSEADAVPNVIDLPSVPVHTEDKAKIKDDFKNIEYNWKNTLSVPPPWSPLALLLAMFFGDQIRRKIQETSHFYKPDDELQRVMVRYRMLEYSLGHIDKAGALVFRHEKNGEASTFGLSFMRSDKSWNTLVFDDAKELSSFRLVNKADVECLAPLHSNFLERYHLPRMRGFLLSSIANLDNDVEYGLMLAYMLGKELDVYVLSDAISSEKCTFKKTIEIDQAKVDPVINLLAKIDNKEELAELLTTFREELIKKIKGTITNAQTPSQVFILARQKGVPLSELNKSDLIKTHQQLQDNVETKLSAVLNGNDVSEPNDALQKMAENFTNDIALKPIVLKILLSMVFSAVKALSYIKPSVNEPSYVTRDEIIDGNSTDVEFSLSGPPNAQYRNDDDDTPLKIVNDSLSDYCLAILTAEGCAAKFRVTPGGEWHPITDWPFVAGAIASSVVLYSTLFLAYGYFFNNQTVKKEDVKLSRLIEKAPEPTQVTFSPCLTAGKTFLLAICYLALPVGGSMAFDSFAVSNTDEDGTVNLTDGFLSGLWICLATCCLFSANDFLSPVKQTKPPEERVRKADQKARQLILKIEEGPLCDLIDNSDNGEGQQFIGRAPLSYSTPPTSRTVDITESPEHQAVVETVQNQPQADLAFAYGTQDCFEDVIERANNLNGGREDRSSTSRYAARRGSHSGLPGPSPCSVQSVASEQATALGARLNSPQFSSADNSIRARVNGNGASDDEALFEIRRVSQDVYSAPGNEGVALVAPVTILNQVGLETGSA